MRLLNKFNLGIPAHKSEKALARKELSNSKVLSKWKKNHIDASEEFRNLSCIKDFNEAILQSNLFPMIFENLKDKKEEEFFRCELFEGNKAWIGRDYSGEYSYYTAESYEEAIAFSIVDILLCFPHVRGNGYTKQTVYVKYEICELLNICSVDELNWGRREREKYLRNSHILDQLKTEDFQMKYPKLHVKIEPYLEVLEKILRHGENYIDPERKDKQDYSSFTCFVSQAGVSSGRFRNAINRFQELGMLYVNKGEISLFDKSVYRHVNTAANFYSMPHYSERMLEQIEEDLNN